MKVRDRQLSLRPFWRYYGAKWRAALRYPQPLHDVIVEPFAGAAGYSLHYPDREVVLVEKYAVIAAIWRWLIGVDAEEVRAIPLVDDVAHLPSWVAPAARSLIGFAMNAATTAPRKALSSAARSLRENGRRFYGWTKDMRERVASQVGAIRHWRIIEGDYTEAPDVVATWFVDSPYEQMGGALPARIGGDRLRQTSDVVPHTPRAANRVRAARRDVAAVPLDGIDQERTAIRKVG